MPTKDQWSNWKQHPTTQWFNHVLETQFKEVTQAVVEGATINEDSVESTALSTVRQLTSSRVLYSIASMTYDDARETLGLIIPGEEEDE
jgi:hypothetical protein